MDIAGKTITIIGGQRSGIALARLIIQLKGIAKITDQDQVRSVPENFNQWAQNHNIALEINGHTKGFICQSDLIVLSPGVHYQAEVVQWANAANIPVLGEIEFSAQYCNKPIIAVTGSNGKTTVSTLISKILQKGGYESCLCGNIGSPFSKYVLDLEDKDYVVLETSSFQLESLIESKSIKSQFSDFKGFKPRIAVILNFSQNHLDRHKDLNEYYSAKKKIYLNQDSSDILILNGQDSESKNIALIARSQINYFNERNQTGSIRNPNYLAVLQVAKLLNISEDKCVEVFQEFEGVEHRLERVRQLNGVDFINDSKATTTQAALWALENIKQPILMICGGRDKNSDFSVISESIQQKVKQMFVIGEARSKISEAFQALIRLEECDGLEEAVTKARQNADTGDCVLLSPMCASFDMFADFEERGRVFKEIVNSLV